MKKLFISDLDGTLLNSHGEASAKTIEMLNDFFDNGGFFTFATARTAASAVKLMKDIRINVPCILMNGVSIYDIEKGVYIKNEYINKDDAENVSEIFSRFDVRPFMYKICNDKLFAVYSGFENDYMKAFFEVRRSKYDKPFVKCNSINCEIDDNVVYFTVAAEYEKLLPVKEMIDHQKGVDCTFYKDVYSEKYWFLEVFSGNASKSGGIEFLRKNYCFEHITCFGDNLNDIAMFNACDIKIAVSNGKDEVKNAADKIIGDNDSDSVALYIKNQILKGYE